MLLPQRKTFTIITTQGTTASCKTHNLWAKSRDQGLETETKIVRHRDKRDVQDRDLTLHGSPDTSRDRDHISLETPSLQTDCFNRTAS